MQLARKSNIQENQLSEKEYRAVELASYSSLKIFAEAPMKFYKQFVTKEIEADEPSKDMIMGSLIHSFLARNDGYIDENQFYIGDVSEIDKSANHPSYFAHKIWEITKADINYNGGDQVKSFDVIAEEAFQQTKFNHKGDEVRFKKKDLAYALEKFIDPKENYEKWYNQKRKCLGKILVNMDDVTNGEKIYNDLRSYKDTQWIYTQATDSRYNVYNELPMFFHHGGIDIKMMPDKVIVDHQEKIIAPYDTKVTWQEDFVKPYLENWYYLQGATYDTGLATWQTKNGLEKYKRLPMQFIRVHNLSWYAPLICPMSSNDLKAAMNGFRTRWGKFYPGFKQIVEELQWALDNSCWRIKRKDYENNSVRMLNIPYVA